MHSTLIQAPCVHHDPEICRVIDSRYACLGFDAMGSRFEFLIDSAGAGLRRYDAQAIAEELRDLVLDWHQRLSIFDSTSIASVINRTAPGSPVFLDAEMYALCALCDQLRVRTRGAFNIAAGTLMHAHGFRDSPATSHGADLDTLDLEHAIVLDHQRQTILKTDDRISIDFGGIAKGFVLDLIRLELEEYGVVNAFIHGGTSSILAIGQNHKGTPWTTCISDNHHLALSGHAVGVSETRSQTQARGADSIGHVMDPFTNQPVNNSINQIVCVHANAATADAYSTACCVNPSLINELFADPCTLIAFDSSPTPTIHDPLAVVQSLGPDHD